VPGSPEIHWDLLPSRVVFAFPYVLSYTSDAVEFRSAVNGALLQTINMPELKLISCKVRGVFGEAFRRVCSTL